MNQEQLNVLLVEDNEDDYRLTSHLLKKNNLKVTWTSTVAGALEAIKNKIFDVVLLDLEVTDSQGAETFNRVHHSQIEAPVIVVLSGNDDELLATELMEHGAQDYLIKGQVTADLLNRSLRYAIQRQRSENELRYTNERLLILNNELLEARDAALEADRLKSAFLANISHEIRTPLAGIVGLSELLVLHDGFDHDTSQIVENLFRSATRLLSLLNDLLDLSRLEQGKMLLAFAICSVRDVIADVVSIVTAAAHSKQLTIDYEVSDLVPEVIMTDPVRLKQIILNFANNAVKFTTAGSVMIHVTLKNDLNLLVEVTDTGIGIDKDQKNLFEPFVQADRSTTRQYGGTGLGLAISKKAVELLGGEIGFNSTIGTGSTFWCTVPIQTVEAGA